jgi:hypothetical protein
VVILVVCKLGCVSNFSVFLVRGLLTVWGRFGIVLEVVWAMRELYRYWFFAVSIFSRV